MHKWHSKRAYTKSEKRLYAEILRECVDDIDCANEVRLQYRIELGVTYCIPDIVMPSLRIAIRVNGGVHGVSDFPIWKDVLQRSRLEDRGWDVIDVYEDERPDLWI